MGSGNFPIYLHEYPLCKDRFVGVHVSAVLFWILKQYHQVLGQDIKKRVENALSNAIEHSIKTHADKSAPYILAIKIGAVAKAAGQLLGNESFERAGESILEQAKSSADLLSWNCPASLGVILSALSMVYTNINGSPWSDFWRHVEFTWDRNTCSFAGPAVKEWQQGSEPQVTLYDFFMGYYGGVLPGRVQRPTPVHLEAMLIPQNDAFIQPFSLPFDLDQNLGIAKFHMHQNEFLSYCILESDKLTINPMWEKGVHSLRLAWGDPQRMHTFVCQGGNSQSISYKVSPNAIEMLFDLKMPAGVEDREKNREVVFFVDAHEGLDFLVSGHRSSTFKLDDVVTMQSDRLKLTLTYALVEGEGRFFGHRMLGNRESQLDVKGSNRYNAFDWQIFLRSISRSENCKIRVRIEFEK